MKNNKKNSVTTIEVEKSENGMFTPFVPVVHNKQALKKNSEDYSEIPQLQLLHSFHKYSRCSLRTNSKLEYFKRNS